MILPTPPYPLVLLAGAVAVAAVGAWRGLPVWRAARARGRAGTVARLLADAPDPWVAVAGGRVVAVSPLWRADRLPGPVPVAGAPAALALDGVLAALPPDEAQALRDAQAALLAQGLPYARRIILPSGGEAGEGGEIEVRGHPAAGLAGAGAGPGPGPGLGGAIIWLRPAGRGAIARQHLERRVQAADLLADRLLVALNALPSPVWLRDAGRRLLWCNAAYAHAVGQDAAGVVRDGVELLTGPGAPGPALAARALDAAAACEERRRVVVAGDLRLLRLVEAPLPPSAAPPSDGGAPFSPLERAALIGMATDATREQELAAELERHTRAHDDVLERLGSAIAIYGADTRMTFHNGAYARMWGLDHAWLATTPTYGEVLEDLRARRRLAEEADFPRWKRRQLAQFQDLREAQEELTHLPDGTTLRRLVVPHPFGGLMFVEEDVTNALALESSYNTLMAVQQETLNNLAEGVAVFGGDGRLKLWNPAYARIWRLTPDDLRGEPHITEVMEKLRPLLAEGDDWQAQRSRMIGNLFERTSFVGRIQRRDQSILTISSVPLPDGAVLISALDVTDSVRVEEALRASNEALATADRLKSEFIANVSHQLRTPLNAIMGFAEILNNQYFGPLNERQADYTKGLLEASTRLLTLINDILDLSTIEAGFMELEWRPIRVAGLLDDVAALARDWAARRGLDLEIEIAPGAEQMVGDERRLKQALYNLVSNAIKFTRPGGRVRLSALRPGAEDALAEGSIVLAVSDTGVGIPPADHARVFNSFERGGSAAGAGLGLSLVKSLIELHGGRVDIATLSPPADGETGAGTPDQGAGRGGTIVRCHLPLRPSV